MKKSKSSTKNSGGIKAILLGSLIIWCAFIVISLIFAIALFSGDDPTGSTALFSLIAFILSGAVGTFLNRKIFSHSDKNLPLISSLLSAALYLAVSAVASGRIAIGSLISAGCFLGSSLLVSMPKKKKVKRHAR